MYTIYCIHDYKYIYASDVAKNDTKVGMNLNEMGRNRRGEYLRKFWTSRHGENLNRGFVSIRLGIKRQLSPLF